MATRGKRRLMGEINVVPYIDVMLVLLIIFMVTAPLLTQGIEVELPKAAAEGLHGVDLDFGISDEGVENLVVMREGRDERDEGHQDQHDDRPEPRRP